MTDFLASSSLSYFVSLVFLLVLLLVLGIILALNYAIVRLISRFSTLTGLAIWQLTVKILCFAFPLLFFIGVFAFDYGWVSFVLTRYSSLGLTALWLFGCWLSSFSLRQKGRGVPDWKANSGKASFQKQMFFNKSLKKLGIP